MEPNTSSSTAAWTSTAALLLSPAFSPAPPSSPSPSLVHASGSGSGPSWCQEIPPSPPAVGVWNGSLSIHAHAHATSSQSPPSSAFPTPGTLPMVGYDLFGNPEATAATPLPTLLGGQWEQEEWLSRAAASVLPEFPSPGLFGFAGESAAWPSEEISSFFSPSSAGGLAVEESPVDAPLPPIEEEEEEIDVSAFLVSDPEDQLPNASWTATRPQMGGDGGGSRASASWMVPRITGNNWPPTLAPAAASTCTMVSTSNRSHSGGSSVGVASSIVGGTMKPSPAVLPQMPPPSQGAGAATSSNFNGFAQPSSSFVLAPLAPPNLQGPLLPVKQEVIEYAGNTVRRPPDYISLVDDDDEDGLYDSAIECSIPGPVLYPPVSETSASRGSLLGLGSASGINGWARNSSDHSQKRTFASVAETRYNVFGSWGGNSSGSPSLAHGSWGGGGSSPNFAPGSWGSSSSSSPSLAPGSWGGSSSSPSLATGSWGASSSSPSIVVSMPCSDRSMSIDNYSSSSSIGEKMPSTSGLPPLPRLRASSSKSSAEIVFTDPEMAIITKEIKLQELLRTNPKKVKRILYNRAYSAVAKTRKVMRTKDLERLVVTLEKERRSLYAELQSLEEGSAALKAKQMEMQRIIEDLEQQAMLKDAVREVLRAEIQKLNHLKLN